MAWVRPFVFGLKICSDGDGLSRVTAWFGSTLTSHSGASVLHMSAIWRCTLGRTLLKTRPNSR